MLVLFVWWAAACGHSQADVGRPEATLSARPDAQAEFRVLRAAWFSGSASERRKLDPELRGFLARFPGDAAGDFVRVLLAMNAVSAGALLEARAQLSAVRERVGAVRDFARVAEAYARWREGKPDSAWTLLEPLSGKIVDPDERLVFGELRLHAATAEQRYERALQAAEELLAEASEEAQRSVQEAIREQFRSAPKAALARGLSSFERTEVDESAVSKARAWLRKMLREQLVIVAVREKDVALARRLLDSAPAALRVSESGSALVEIAGGQSVPLISGRAIGVALSLGDAELRRRSANLAAGLARGLGLPDSARKPGAVRLITHDDGGSSAGTQAALGELAAEGAAILIAGVDLESATLAARFADEHAIAVMLVDVPAATTPPYRQAFVLGESLESQQRALDTELARRNLDRVARIGRGLGAACDAPLTTALGSRFPIDEWRRARASALVVFGPAACAAEAEHELRGSGLAPLLALGLEAADYLDSPEASGPRFALGAGSFPSAARAAKTESSVLPAADWYEALGHDAALLAEGALQGFPEGRVDDGRAVDELHARAARALASSEAALWTSDARRFSDARVLPRRLTIVSPEPPARKTP